MKNLRDNLIDIVKIIGFIAGGFIYCVAMLAIMCAGEVWGLPL